MSCSIVIVLPKAGKHYTNDRHYYFRLFNVIKLMVEFSAVHFY